MIEIGTNNSKENGIFITMDHKSVDKVRNRLEKLINASENSRSLTYQEELSKNVNENKLPSEYLVQTSFHSNRLLSEFENENFISNKELEKINFTLNKWLQIFGITKNIDFKKEEIPEFKDG
jgi:hypothetical protein